MNTTKNLKNNDGSLHPPKNLSKIILATLSNLRFSKSVQIDPFQIDIVRKPPNNSEENHD